MNKYLYNGKELQTDLDLGWYDYGWRMFDPTIARWNGIDNLSEKYNSYSPYHYAGNNPVRNIDIDGNEFTDSAWKWVTDLLTDLESRVNTLTSKIDEKTQQLKSGTNKKGKALSAKKKEKLAKQIGNLSGQVNSYMSVASGIRDLAASDQLYDIQQSNSLNESGPVQGMGTNVGGAGFDFSSGTFTITLPSGANNSFIAHELQHAHQFENGQYSIGPKINDPTYWNLLYDKHDELNAYNQWGALFNGKTYSGVSSLDDRYKDVATGPVDATTHPSIGALINLNLPASKEKSRFQSIANNTGHAFRVNGVTYFRKR